MIISLCLLLSLLSLSHGQLSDELTIQLDDYQLSKNETFVAVSQKISGTYIVSFETINLSPRVKHMMLYGCKRPFKNDTSWEGLRTCAYGIQRILFASGSQPSKLVMPRETAFSVGHAEDEQEYLILQIEFSASSSEDTVSSGVKLRVVPEKPQNLAAVLLMVSGFSLPSGMEQFQSNATCLLQSETPIQPFAYRVRTNHLGRVVSGYFYHMDRWRKLGKQDPQTDQSFLPTKEEMLIRHEDQIAASCRFDTSNETEEVWGTSGEMCNFYIMFSWKADLPHPFPRGAACVEEDGDLSGYPSEGFSLMTPQEVKEQMAMNDKQQRFAVEMEEELDERAKTRTVPTTTTTTTTTTTPKAKSTTKAPETMTTQSQRSSTVVATTRSNRVQDQHPQQDSSSSSLPWLFSLTFVIISLYL